MKTCEEQIAEMAKDLEQAKDLAMGTVGSLNNGFGGWYGAYMYNQGYRKQSDTVRGLMKGSIILLVKECIAAHACVQTENGNVVGYFLDDLAIDRIANDVAEAMEVEE